jgi:hypothetical protein
VFPRGRVSLKGRKAKLTTLLFICTLGVLGIAGKAEIQVRLIDAHSGRPFADREVELFGTNAPSGLNTRDTLFHLQTTTGRDGVARFLMTAPLPYWLVFYSAQANGCGPAGFNSFVAAEVMQSGIVVPNTCASKRQKFDWRKVIARPGEIIIFAVEPRGP